MADKLLDILSNQGWHLTKEGYDQITDAGAKNDLKVITQLLLDIDIKDYGKPMLNSLLNNSKLSKIVLQIQKIKNISAPKSNQDSQGAPRMLKLIVTDGHNYCQAIETDYLPFLNHNQTSPGSKLLINNADINSGYIILNENSCILLGGKVASLYEKWEINKTVAKHTRGMYDGEGPPPWVSFGRKIQSSTNNQSFKSLDNKAKTKESSEFDVQRQDAIAEVSTGAIRKVFGGGVKQQHSQNQNINQIREKKTQNYKEKIKEKKVAKKELKNDEKPQKQPEKVSLFDFLEDKLPPSEDLPTQAINNVEDVRTTKSGYKYNNDKIKYNQPRNTYPVQQNNRYQQQNYNYNQGQSFNSNYQQSRGNQFNYSNTQQNNYKQQNSQYPTQYYSNKINENKFWNEFQQMSIATPKNSIPENTQSVNKTPNDRSADRTSLNSEFASRSLRQYLNIQPNKQRSSHVPESTKDSNQVLNNYENSGTSNQITWKVGDQCMAKYWEDNKFYNATITALTNRTCVVQFNEYGNIEEILQCDCLPIKNTQQEINKSQSANNTMEFRKGGNRFYNSNNKNYGKPRF